MINDHPTFKIYENGFYFNIQEQDEALELYKELKRADMVKHKTTRLIIDKFCFRSLVFENGAKEKIITFTHHLNPMTQLVLDPRNNTYVSRLKLEEEVGQDYESFKRRYIIEQADHRRELMMSQNLKPVKHKSILPQARNTLLD
jgi:hypothetical protein